MIVATDYLRRHDMHPEPAYGASAPRLPLSCRSSHPLRDGRMRRLCPCDFLKG